MKTEVEVAVQQVTEFGSESGSRKVEGLRYVLTDEIFHKCSCCDHSRGNLASNEVLKTFLYESLPED